MFIIFDLGIIGVILIMLLLGFGAVVDGATAAAAGFMIAHARNAFIIFVILSIVIGTLAYIGINDIPKGKKHIASIICYNIGVFLVFLPYYITLYLSVIPQGMTSLGNRIICGVFFFFLMCGAAYAHCLLFESEESYETGKMISVGVISLVITYVLNRMVISNTDAAIYLQIYGERVGGIILKAFGQV